MKVLLINPPYPFDESPTPPFGLISLAAYLLEKGIEVRIEDYIVTPYSPERVKMVLSEFQPHVVGATGVTMNIKKSLKIIKDYKEEDPNLFTVMGGPHVTFDADNILSQNNYVDCIVRGEGELTTVELLERLDAGLSLREVAGLSYRDNGKIVHNPNRPLIEDINVLPYPARHLIQLSKYRALGLPVNMVTSRGCPHKCIFCVGSKMVGRKVRYYDVNRVVDEFEMLSKLAFKQINIVDDLFTSKKNRCIAICQEMVRRGISHPWTAFARVDTVSRELLENLKESGCTTLCFGIESGNQEILDTIKKKITLEKCQKAVALCNEVGIDPMTSYILGLPGETHETITKTVDFAKKLSPNHGFHILAPFPGTEVREKKEEYGLRILTDDWDAYDANRSVSETDFISASEIDRIADKFNFSISNYVSVLAQKKDKGEALSTDDENFVSRIISFDFAQQLMMNELIEKYPPSLGGIAREKIIGDFMVYVEKNTKFSPDDIKKELGRLFELNCVTVDENKNPIIEWS
jgi:anaerobic magnesium-protoporphyrin IX monomethyl ester cyclase